MPKTELSLSNVKDSGNYDCRWNNGHTKMRFEVTVVKSSSSSNNGTESATAATPAATTTATATPPKSAARDDLESRLVEAVEGIHKELTNFRYRVVQKKRSPPGPLRGPGVYS